MTKSIIQIFATVSILLSVAMMTEEVYAQHDQPLAVLQQSSGIIPDWVDQNFKWYAQEQISQTEIVNSLEFLVSERIILLPSMQTVEAQEITQSIEDLQLRIDELEYSDDEEIQATIAILERQTEILEGGPQALTSLDDEELASLKCPKLPKDSNITTKLGVASCKIGSWLLDKFSKTSQEEEHEKIEFEELGLQIQKAEVVDLEEPPGIPEGATGTYVKYKKGTPDNFKLTVKCDAGDVATGGGFAPALSPDSLDFHASMPHPTNYANNPRMNNPTGWTYYSSDSGEARVWVVCLDLTPSGLTAGTTIP